MLKPFIHQYDKENLCLLTEILNMSEVKLVHVIVAYFKPLLCRRHRQHRWNIVVCYCDSVFSTIMVYHIQHHSYELSLFCVSAAHRKWSWVNLAHEDESLEKINSLFGAEEGTEQSWLRLSISSPSQRNTPRPFSAAAGDSRYVTLSLCRIHNVSPSAAGHSVWD